MSNPLQDPDTLKNTLIVPLAQVIGANATAWGFAFTQINGLLTSISLVLATCFTLYKFIREMKKK